VSFLVNPYWYASAGCTDTDALAFLTAAGITDATISTAICTLVTSMKANGTWAKCSAIYPMVGGTAATHKFNLKNPTDTNAAYRLSFVGGWTHSANGALPNGTNAYAETFLNASLTYTTSIAISYYSRTNANTGTDQIDFGCTDSTNFLWISAQYNASGFVNRFLSRNSSITIIANAANADARGFYLSSKTSNSANAFKIFKNGVVQNTQTGAGSFPNATLFLGAYNNLLSPSVLFSNRQCAFATISTGLTDAEAATLYTDVQAFQTSLSRNV